VVEFSVAGVVKAVAVELEVVRGTVVGETFNAIEWGAATLESATPLWFATGLFLAI
jgi:hypothetical protein